MGSGVPVEASTVAAASPPARQPDPARRPVDPSSASFATSPAGRCPVRSYLRSAGALSPASPTSRDAACSARCRRVTTSSASTERDMSRPAACSCPRSAPTPPGRLSSRRSRRVRDSRQQPPAAPDILAAGFIGNTALELADPSPAEDESSHDHSEVAWRLKHLKRSVLRRRPPRDLRRGRRSGKFDRAVADLFTGNRSPASGGEPAERLPVRRRGQPLTTGGVPEPAANSSRLDRRPVVLGDGVVGASRPDTR